MSKVYRRTPSELLRVGDELAAYFLDRACRMFGEAVEADIRAAESSSKSPAQTAARQQRALAKWLNHEMKFRDPAARPGSSEEKGTVKL